MKKSIGLGALLLSAIVIFIFSLAILSLNEIAGIGVAIFGLSFVIYGYYKILIPSRIYTWCKIDASVDSCSILEHDILESEASIETFYSPTLHYQYDYEGKHYYSDCISHDIRSIWSKDRDKIEKLIELLRQSQTISVYVNPKNPRESVVYANLSAKRLNHFYTIIFSGILLIAIGIFLYIFSYT